MGAGDVYMRGHQLIGVAARQAGLFAAGSIPFMLQNVGTTISRALTTHMMAAFPTATFHFFSDTETWTDDVVHERLDPVNGFLRVPELPGLGVTLDREGVVLEPPSG
jgi:L-alanine-DL-glutamate epimerase-like enolase superfamily enzyme